MNRYATIDQVKQEIDTTKALSEAADLHKFLWWASGVASERIDQITADVFNPRIDTRYFNARGRHILSASTLDVVEGQPKDSRPPLLEITSVTLDGAGSPVSSADYQADPKGITPIRRITFTDGDSWQEYASDWRGVHAIAGVWGNRKRYSTAWVNSGDTVENNPLTAAGTSISVNDADAITGDWALPRFQAGQLLRIGTGTDYRTVESVNTGTNVLSVLPHANGSTSIEQAQNTAIYIWEPEPVIQRAAIRWASYLKNRQGEFSSITYDGLTTKSFPLDIPDEVANILIAHGYCDVRILAKVGAKAD